MEVEKLMEAGFIREVEYPKWIANVVLVKKMNGNRRICVKLSLVDATSGYGLLSFMDAFAGYNQIKMFEPD